MPILFLSGGIDSTTLGFDIAKHPHRYGVSDRNRLVLTTVSKYPTQRKRELSRIVRAIESVATIPVIHEVVDDGLRGEAFYPLPIGGAQSLNMLSKDRSPFDVATMRYSAGWMLWMAAYATNRLYWEQEAFGQEYGPEYAFVAHQHNGPAWGIIDAGNAPKTDTVPAFFASLNRTIAESGEQVEVRCPFLEWRMNRAMVVRLALDLGVPLHETSSCQAGWKKNCGACGACLLRQGAFRTLGVKEE